MLGIVYTFKCCYSLHNTEMPWICRDNPTPVLPWEALHGEQTGTTGLTAHHTSTSIAGRKTWHFSALPCHITTPQVTTHRALLEAAPRGVQQTGPPLHNHMAWRCMTDPRSRKVWGDIYCWHHMKVSVSKGKYNQELLKEKIYSYPGLFTFLINGVQIILL